MSEGNKQRLKEYQKNYREAKKSGLKKFQKLLILNIIKMEKPLTYGEYDVNKYRFHMCKRQISINTININRILLSNKVFYGELGAYKYYVGYNHDQGVRPLYVVIP